MDKNEIKYMYIICFFIYLCIYIFIYFLFSPYIYISLSLSLFLYIALCVRSGTRPSLARGASVQIDNEPRGLLPRFRAADVARNSVAGDAPGLRRLRAEAPELIKQHHDTTTPRHHDSTTVRVYIIYIYEYKNPRTPQIPKIQTIQHMNYGIYTKYKIKNRHVLFFDFSLQIQQIECVLALLVYFV